MDPLGANGEVLRLAVGTIDAGLAVVGLDHRFLWVNRWLDDRYPLFAPLEGSKCHRLIAGSDEPCAGCPLTSIGDGPRRIVTVVPCPARVDESTWVEVQGSLLSDAAAQVIGVVAHFQDVSEQKRLDREHEAARAALEDEVSKRRALFEQSRDGIVVLTRDGEVFEANEAYARQLGYTLDEVYGLHIWDWNKSYTPEELLQVLRGDDPRGRVFSTYHTRKDGSGYPVEITSNAVTLGGQVYILCSCRDVSEAHRADDDRRAVQSALDEEASRRRLLVEQSRDGIVVLDETGKVWESNEAFAAMLGYSTEEILTLHVWDWEYQFPRERINEMIEAIDPAGDHFVTSHRRKDGSTYEVEISTNGAIYGGHKFIFCVCRDITEKVKAEKEREALIARLQEALAELKTLRGIIPVCSFCKKVRDDRGYWEQVEVYIKKNSEADVSHGICPDCLKKHFPGMRAKPELETGGPGVGE